MRVHESLGISVPISAATAAQGAMAAQAATTAQTSLWDDISKAVNTLAPAAAQAYVGLQTAKAIKKNPGMLLNQSAPQQPTQQPTYYQQAPGMSNTMKIALAAGGVALLGLVVIALMKKRSAGPR